MTSLDPALTIDSRNLACPLPVLRLRKVLSGHPAGTLVDLLATDRAAARDVPAFCIAAGHKLLDVEDTNGVMRFRIKSGSAA